MSRQQKGEPSISRAFAARLDHGKIGLDEPACDVTCRIRARVQRHLDGQAVFQKGSAHACVLRAATHAGALLAERPRDVAREGQVS